MDLALELNLPFPFDLCLLHSSVSSHHFFKLLAHMSPAFKEKSWLLFPLPLFWPLKTCLNHKQSILIISNLFALSKTSDQILFPQISGLTNLLNLYISGWRL